MHDTEALVDTLRHAADAKVVDAVEELVRDGKDEDLVHLNALSLAAERHLDEEATIATLLHASRLGLFELSWNILCPSCAGVLDANATLKTVRQEGYHCGFCALESEPLLDNSVEVTFGVSPRVRRIGAHDPQSLEFWDYHRQIFFSSGVTFPKPARFRELASSCILEAVELGAGERMILALQLPVATVIVSDPVTHTAVYIEVGGEPVRERQETALVFDTVGAKTGRLDMRPGPLRLSLDNRTAGRVLPGVMVTGPELDTLIGGRRPFLTAKRLLSNQTFRDIYRTDTLDVDQRLKILSLSFLFTDLKGSTALYERVGDLVAYDLVRAHFRVLAEAVGAEGGAIVKTIGDAVMATFPTPDRALAAALRMRDAMRRLNESRKSEDLVLKIGLHEGPCLAVSLNERQDYFGQTVNIASRVQELAEADAIFATEAVLRHPDAARLLCDRGIDARSQARRLRGIENRVEIFELQ